MRRARFRTLVLGAALAGLLFLGACPPPVQTYSQKARRPPAQVNCVTSSCTATAKPFVLGGRDFSPPTLANIARWQAAGFFADQPYDQIQADYRAKGYDWYEDDLRCNCLCRGSAHAAFGGRCLEEPVPGTAMYEAVLLGKRPPKRRSAGRGGRRRR